MGPYYKHADITIYCGDSRDILPALPCADALVTDPPFGIDWIRATWTDRAEEYPDFMRWLVSEARRIVPRGWCFVFQSMTTCGRFHEWFPEGWRIFAACKNFAQIRPTGVWHSWDPVIFWKNGQNPCRTSRCLNRDYFVGDVVGSLIQKAGHPCPKPLDTMRHIVLIACPVGGTVIDPFMGSGTTLVAAKQLGCGAIGIEIEERYCEIAVKRLAQETLDFKSPEASEASGFHPALRDSSLFL